MLGKDVLKFPKKFSMIELKKFKLEFLKICKSSQPDIE